MQISEVTIDDLKGYSNVYHSLDDNLFSAILMGAKHFLVSYTGLPMTAEDPDDETLDDHEDLTIALFILASEMYDNRMIHVESNKIGFVIQHLLGSHSINLL